MNTGRYSNLYPPESRRRGSIWRALMLALLEMLVFGAALASLAAPYWLGECVLTSGAHVPTSSLHTPAKPSHHAPHLQILNQRDVYNDAATAMYASMGSLGSDLACQTLSTGCKLRQAGYTLHLQAFCLHLALPAAGQLAHHCYSQLLLLARNAALLPILIALH